MLKWTLPRRAEPSEELSSVITSEPTPRRSYHSSRHSFGGKPKRSRDQRRQSLINKENDLHASLQSINSIRNPQATSTPFSHHQKSTALRDVGNTTPTNLSPATHPNLHKRTLPPSPLEQPRQIVAPTLPTFGVEYSPMNATRSGQAIALRGITVPDSFFGSARYFRDGVEQPSKRPRIDPPMGLFNNLQDEEEDLNMSSKALNDQDLDQMIDEILASKRKVAPIPKFIPNSNHPKIPCFNKKKDEISLKLQKFIDSKSTVPLSPLLPQSQIDELIQEHPFLRESIEILAGLNTPPKIETNPDAVDNYLKVKCSPLTSNEMSPSLNQNFMLGGGNSGTPSSNEMTIRRCLKFSESPESMADADWLDKRKSVASTVSTTSSRCSLRSGSGGTGIISGTLELSVRVEKESLMVHVIRCKDLCRSNGCPINAYVKVAVLPTIQMPPQPSTATGYQRTSVHRNSAQPLFDHRFVFDGIANPSTEPQERVQLTVWHRDRDLKRSEFLGCMSFPILPNKIVSGIYLLQPQSCLVNPLPPVFQTSPTKSHQLTENSLNNLLAEQCSWEHNYHTPAVASSQTENIWNQATLRGQSAVNQFLTYLDRQQSSTNGVPAALTSTDRRKSVDPSYKTSFCVR